MNVPMDTSTLCLVLFIGGAFIGLLATVKDGVLYATGRKTYKPWLPPDDPLNNRLGQGIALTGLGFLLGTVCVFFLGVWGRIVLLGSVLGFAIGMGGAFVTWRTQREIEKLNGNKGQESYESKS